MDVGSGEQGARTRFVLHILHPVRDFVFLGLLSIAFNCTAAVDILSNECWQENRNNRRFGRECALHAPPEDEVTSASGD